MILPRIVDLAVTCGNQTRHAKVVWRSGTQAGLAFLDASEPDRNADARAKAEAAGNTEPLPGPLH